MKVSNEKIINLKKKDDNKAVNPRELAFNHPNADRKDEEDAGNKNNGFVEWQTFEHSYFPKTRVWFIVLGVLAALTEIYFLAAKNFFGFTTFLFVFFAVFLYAVKKPGLVRFQIDHRGIWAGDYLYKFEDFESFWIFYEPPEVKEIFLKRKGALGQLLIIPFEEENPVALRKVLRNYLPEVEEEESLIDMITRVIGF